MLKTTAGALSRVLLSVLYIFIQWIPWNHLRSLSWIIVKIVMILIPRLRKIAAANLNKVFNAHLTRNEKDSIIVHSFYHFVISIFESMRASSMNDRQLKDLFHVDGLEHVQDALKKGRGAIICSAHLGNFALAAYHLKRAGFDLHIILRPPHDGHMRRFVERVMTDAHCPYHFDDKRTVAVRILRILQGNGIVFLAGDQYAPGGTEVTFMGLPTLTANGPVVLASRSGAPILTLFTMRLPNGQHRVIIEPEPILASSSDDGAAIDPQQWMLQSIGQRLEKHIHFSPDQWLWLHRRWKNLSIYSP